MTPMISALCEKSWHARLRSGAGQQWRRGDRTGDDFHPDLVLVDVQMPGLSGLETVRRLRDIESCLKTPIVALTAFAEKYQRRRTSTPGLPITSKSKPGSSRC